MRLIFLCQQRCWHGFILLSSSMSYYNLDYCHASAFANVQERQSVKQIQLPYFGENYNTKGNYSTELTSIYCSKLAYYVNKIILRISLTQFSFLSNMQHIPRLIAMAKYCRSPLPASSGRLRTLYNNFYSILATATRISLISRLNTIMF